jgi:hypothetical protein
LQSVRNAAAKTTFRLQQSDHVTPALTELHWLSEADSVNFKVATLAYCCPHGIARDICMTHCIGSPKLKPATG